MSLKLNEGKQERFTFFSDTFWRAFKCGGGVPSSSPFARMLRLKLRKARTNLLQRLHCAFGKALVSKARGRRFESFGYFWLRLRLRLRKTSFKHRKTCKNAFECVPKSVRKKVNLSCLPSFNFIQPIALFAMKLRCYLQ